MDISIWKQEKNAFEKQTQGISNEIAKIGTTFNADMGLFEKHAGTFGRIGIKLLEQSKFINATNIKLARDGIVAVAKFTGIDLALKFKPWGAVNLAGNLNKALPLIGIVIEGVDSLIKYKKQQEFEKAKREMESDFNNQKQEILDLINDETRFKQTCFPSAFELEKCIQACEESVKKNARVRSRS
ncbi:hypothetical protein HPY1089_03430 [Helicobacter pylori]|nr:hypothetical protein HPY1152_03580 [Helicobacter pylori]KHL79119.1 hypothetical protein HPY1089_03430 [Helicobacter pylori]